MMISSDNDMYFLWFFAWQLQGYQQHARSKAKSAKLLEVNEKDGNVADEWEQPATRKNK